MLPNRYNPKTSEDFLREFWQVQKLYAFELQDSGEVYSIDTPPPTVSGFLHLGHVYSFSQTDFMARFWRMRGRRVFYPMGFDDNGLPTERFVERGYGIRSRDVSRQDFIEHCLRVSEEVELKYRDLWQRLGLSIDWNFTYRTIDSNARQIAQWSFLDLYQKGLVYRQEAPAIWCPECQASFAQADLNDLDRQSEFITLDFQLEQAEYISIATTRPELLSACVAVFVHPSDHRYLAYVGQEVEVPFYGQHVPVLVDPAVDIEKGTGAVMCCTFGDPMDVAWWRSHHLSYIGVISADGRMMESSGPLAGFTVEDARQKIKELLKEQDLIRDSQPTAQSVRVHERCDTPVEYLMVNQWFIRLLDHKQEFLELGEQLKWYPNPMKERYLDWVGNLSWDWSISRQRSFGVPFPLWYCASCQEVLLADVKSLPVDPLAEGPGFPCPNCGSEEFIPEHDFFDTWMTSSCTPQIVGGWQENSELYNQVYPFTLRPHAHEIIRTWTFYSVVKSYFHFGRLPWRDVAISGWGIAGEGMGKISKSRGGGPAEPIDMIDTYSADAVRYWAASTGPGKDAIISEEKIQNGLRLVNKLWSVARFTSRFIQQEPTGLQIEPPTLSPGDQWILTRLEGVIRRATIAMEGYDYSSAKNEVEEFFWRDLADNYLEMAKQRLYDPIDPNRLGALFSLQRVFLTVLKLFAPFLPYITDTIYRELFAAVEGKASIHVSDWAGMDRRFEDPAAGSFGETLVGIATAVRRYKSQHNLPLGTTVKRLQLAAVDSDLLERLRESESDLKSITRAEIIHVTDYPDGSVEWINTQGPVMVGIQLG